MPVIEVEGLRKEYRRLRGGRTVALDGLDLSVPEGGVFGFLGPNGAGKTTTIRCLLGLVRPSAGRSRLLGASNERELRRVTPRVGSLVEAPAFAARMSGRRNLRLLAGVDGIGDAAVRTVLDRVGLADRADDSVRTYSLGMKQRLAIAAALLKDPAVLILDEPANGLDPAGIKEVRELLKTLGAEGRTVFVSSHILSEVQQMADRVAIIARGRTVVSGPVHEVLESRRRSGLLVRVEDAAAAAAVLGEVGIAATVHDGLVRAEVPDDDGARVTRALAERGIYLSELRPDEADLETVFLEVTSGGSESPAPAEGPSDAPAEGSSDAAAKGSAEAGR
jgi:ABC-2 type transport system ATP-binding protein